MTSRRRSPVEVFSNTASTAVPNCESAVDTFVVCSTLIAAVIASKVACPATLTNLCKCSKFRSLGTPTKRQVQGHELTPLRVKGDTEDVSSELDNDG
ncbi:hypothetical protein TNCV_4316681 [Trichonephila clavipes]|nr:hypothetical protein TNCV_4316681 [Trichonephila clavipes]